MAVFLDDAVAVGADPHVVVAVEGAAVDGVRDYFGIAPGVDQGAGRVEHQDGRGLLRSFLFFVGDVAAVDYHYVIMGVGADAAELAGDPTGGQGLGPGGIDFELGRVLGDEG